MLQQLRREARQDLILECRKHSEAKLLRTVPWLGPIRVALLIGRVQTPHRFRTKRQFWAYCGLALETRDSGEYRVVNGQIERKKKPLFIRGLNRNHNHDLKNLFKSAATTASGSEGAFGAVLRKPSEKRDASGDGAADAGAQDRCHYVACVEERRGVRRRVCEATSRLSARHRRERPSFTPRFSVRAASSGSRVSIFGRVRLRVRCGGPSLTGHRMLPRITQQSHTGRGSGSRVSDRTMVGPLSGTTVRLGQLQLAKDVVARR